MSLMGRASNHSPVKSTRARSQPRLGFRQVVTFQGGTDKQPSVVRQGRVIFNPMVGNLRVGDVLRAREAGDSGLAVSVCITRERKRLRELEGVTLVCAIRISEGSFGTDFKSLGVENGEGDLIHVGPVISAIRACFALDTNDEFRRPKRYLGLASASASMGSGKVLAIGETVDDCEIVNNPPSTDNDLGDGMVCADGERCGPFPNTFEVVELNGFLGLYFLLSEAVTDALGDGLRRSNGHFGQMVVYEVWKAGD
jgi:hypothetical protein